MCANFPASPSSATSGSAAALPIRVAVVTEARDLAGVKLHPSVARALEQASVALADAGYEIVDERTPGFTRAKDLWFDMQMPEFRQYLLPLIEKEGDEGIRTAVRFMCDNVPPSDAVSHMKALAERTRLIREWNLFLDRVPLVLAPICSEPVYRQGFDIESAERTAALWRECATMMAVAVLGLPATAVPTGVVDELPMGVQIVGPRFREDLCLAAAEAIEARADMPTPIDPAW